MSTSWWMLHMMKGIYMPWSRTCGLCRLHTCHLQNMNGLWLNGQSLLVHHRPISLHHAIPTSLPPPPHLQLLRQSKRHQQLQRADSNTNSSCSCSSSSNNNSSSSSSSRFDKLPKMTCSCHSKQLPAAHDMPYVHRCLLDSVVRDDNNKGSSSLRMRTNRKFKSIDQEATRTAPSRYSLSSPQMGPGAPSPHQLHPSHKCRLKPIMTERLRPRPAHSLRHLQQASSHAPAPAQTTLSPAPAASVATCLPVAQALLQVTVRSLMLLKPPYLADPLHYSCP
mmetsp:Transcript_15067/g.24803  ORF Transcript_15067/g.24803 Transcript_15067/m.24803 type:complete len:279 (+) Transcript_15067:515-1351(+)